MANRIWLCDSERKYAEHLMEYLIQNLPLSYEIQLFTSREKLEINDHLGEVILIISEREFQQDLVSCGFQKILVLNESGNYFEKDVVSISKYQAVSRVVSEIRKICASHDSKMHGSLRHMGPMHIFGVYTPLSRCLQTTFSLTTGQILARQGKVLYLNFEGFSGLEQLLGREFQGSVADLLYYCGCAKNKLESHLYGISVTIGGMDMIPPMKSFLELRAISGREWLDLFQTIEEVTEYEYLILDLSEQIDSLFDLLRACETVFTIYREDPISLAKMKEYEQLLKCQGYEDVAAKTIHLEFPVFQELPANFEHLTHGELADCIRNKLKEEGV